MSYWCLKSDDLVLEVVGDGLVLRSHRWPALHVGPIEASVVADGAAQEAVTREIASEADPGPAMVVRTAFAPSGLELVQRISLVDGGFDVSSVISNASSAPVALTSVDLLKVASNGLTRFGAEPGDVKIYERGGYWARVRGLGVADEREAASGEEDALQRATHSSQFVWVAYDGAEHRALLVGFETAERWLGAITTEGRPGRDPEEWRVWFDGSDVLLDPGATVPLEDLVILCGRDPVALLEHYGDLVAARHAVSLPAETPVSWCSWYPFRLGVTHERVVENARIAAERLRPLGLRIMEVDLGWQREYLSNASDENDQFPLGLRGLAEDLGELGFVLGAWMAPYSISALDPVATAHPEWLLRGTDGDLLSLGEWFWEPHGQTHALDLTHPGAQEHLRTVMRSLAERGVRYLKPDFVGSVTRSDARGRHDPRIVAGGGAEAARIGMQIMCEEMTAGSAEALVLNCGCPDLPGTGAFPLLYSCADTGNTGYVGWRHLREDYGANVAGHLWKNRRWGIIQPSCLVVGLPGTLEEARLRATATFLAGGQVDISDDLTTLPEDRWQVLLATLPPLGVSATPVDLFEPIGGGAVDYEGMSKGDATTGPGAGAPDDVSRVWRLAVEREWDAWTLVGLFSYDAEGDAEYGKARIATFRLPLDRLGLDPDRRYWVHEFWSGQFLGEIPADRANPHGYVHPGDAQALVASPAPGMVEVSFFGPCAKLLVLRPVRPHPWIVGTSFHQSGGAELTDVAWGGHVLSGVLVRPASQQGYIVVAGNEGLSLTAIVAGSTVRCRPGANGSVIVPVTTSGDVTPWRVEW